jgi:hypothetical protein
MFNRALQSFLEGGSCEVAFWAAFACGIAQFGRTGGRRLR